MLRRNFSFFQVAFLNRPSFASILFGLIPFAAVCLTVGWWDRVYPMVFGLPFNFFWLLLWLVVTPVCLWGAYRMEIKRLGRSQRDAEREAP